MIETQRRDDILRAIADAAEGTLVPSECADQAGGGARSRRRVQAKSHVGDADGGSGASRLDPGLVAALLLLAYTIARRGPAWSAWRACCCSAGPRAGPATHRGRRAPSRPAIPPGRRPSS